MYKVYGDLASGNCYKIKLAMHQLNIPHKWIHTDLMQGECRQPEFLQKNPNGKVPLLEIDTNQYLPESNAILFFLAENSPLLPDTHFQKAQVLQWLFYEQYSHEPYIATARFIVKFLQEADRQAASLAEKYPKGYKALDLMEQHLKQNSFFAANRYTIADIALYAYTHVAEEGGFDLRRYTHIHRWFDRIRQHPLYIGMQDAITAQTRSAGSPDN